MQIGAEQQDQQQALKKFRNRQSDKSESRRQMVDEPATPDRRHNAERDAKARYDGQCRDRNHGRSSERRPQHWCYRHFHDQRPPEIAAQHA